MKNVDGKIIVAMSGGVDSSVAAHLLHAEGHDAVGISMQVWDYRKNGGCDSRATCCSPDDFTDARQVAAKIGIPYYVFDFEKTFRKEVIDNFVETYARGETPNPCVDCNNKVKFAELRDRAMSLGCSAVATGHYARVSHDEQGYHLLRGSDLAKDQSYFLYGLSQSELSQTLFPLGEMTKEEVREIAREYGLVTANKPESQDICFVSGKVQDFLSRYSTNMTSGNIVRTDGTVIGKHESISNFTVGQRKGIGLGGFENPLYVLEINPSNFDVVVGERDELEKELFYVRELSWMSPKILKELETTREFTFRAMVQMRHRHRGVLADVTVSNGLAQVRFIDEWSTISPGQAAVFYDETNSEVLGGGRILAESKLRDNTYASVA